MVDLTETFLHTRVHIHVNKLDSHIIQEIVQAGTTNIKKREVQHPFAM
jgi:hypothetical protein